MREMQSASFNGADIVVVNVVRPDDPWGGLVMDSSFKDHIKDFIKLVE